MFYSENNNDIVWIGGVVQRLISEWNYPPPPPRTHSSSKVELNVDLVKLDLTDSNPLAVVQNRR